MKMWIARDEGAAYCKLFTIKPDKQYSHYYEREIWTAHHPDTSVPLEVYEYPEVTFENSPQQVELKLIKPRKTPGPQKSEYVEFEGIVKEVYKGRSLNGNYAVYGDHKFFFDGYCRTFSLKQGKFTKIPRPKVGDRILLSYRKTKKYGTNKEYFDFIKAKIVKVL